MSISRGVHDLSEQIYLKHLYERYHAIDIELAITARHPFYNLERKRRYCKTVIKQNLIQDPSFVKDGNSLQIGGIFWKLSDTLSESVLKVVSAESNSILLPKEEPINTSPKENK